MSFLYTINIPWLIISRHLMHCNLFRINGLSSSVNAEFLHISGMSNPLAALKVICKNKSMGWCLSNIALFKLFALNNICKNPCCLVCHNLKENWIAWSYLPAGLFSLVYCPQNYKLCVCLIINYAAFFNDHL